GDAGPCGRPGPHARRRVDCRGGRPHSGRTACAPGGVMSRSTRRGLPAAGVAAPADRRFRRPELLPQRHRRLERTIWSVGRWVLVLAALGLAGTWGAQRVAPSELFLVREI